jgi:hypothetical protein
LGSGERPKAPETDAAAGRAGDAMRGGGARRLRYGLFPPGVALRWSEDSQGKGSEAKRRRKREGGRRRRGRGVEAKRKR